MTKRIELLSPARDSETAIATILCGADAVYIGAERFGAREQAGNTTAAIQQGRAFLSQTRGSEYRAGGGVGAEYVLADGYDNKILSATGNWIMSEAGFKDTGRTADFAG
jgi:hypothetical protein